MNNRLVATNRTFIFSSDEEYKEFMHLCTQLTDFPDEYDVYDPLYSNIVYDMLFAAVKKLDNSRGYFKYTITKREKGWKLSGRGCITCYFHFDEKYVMFHGGTDGDFNIGFKFNNKLKEFIVERSLTN